MKCSGKFILPFFLYPWHAFAQDTLCDILDLPNCDTVNRITRRASAKSIPSSGSSSQFNPANVSQDRGIGVESFFQSGNPMNFALVTGTGRMGAAVMSSGNENGFFGNRIIEDPGDFLDRHRSKLQYQSQKYSGAFGAGLLKNRNVNFDLGVSAKYNQDIHRLNPGAGLSLRYGPASIGFANYRDDVALRSDTLDPDEPQEARFSAQSFFAGVRIKSFFFDFGNISTVYDGSEEKSLVRLYSTAFIHEKFLFNLAYRQEDSHQLKVEDDAIVDRRTQSSVYAGIQYSVHKLVILGVHYNYYLLREVSGSIAVFF